MNTEPNAAVRGGIDPGAMVLGVLFVTMWSSAFTTARIIVLEVAPLTALMVRFAISGVLCVGIARLIGQSLDLSRRQWLACIVFGVCQNAIYLGANFISMQWIEASLAAIIASTMPFQVAVLNLLFFGVRLNPVGIGGLLVGFLGVLIIVTGRISMGLELLGVVLCLVASIGFCLATLAVRQATSGGNLMMIVGIQLLVGCAVLVPLALVFETAQMPDVSFRLVAAFSYQTLVPGIVATWLWFYLINRIGPTRASSFHFLNPFLGVVVAAAVLGEPVGFADFVGVAIITAGILAVQMAKETQHERTLSSRQT